MMAPAVETLSSTSKLVIVALVSSNETVDALLLKSLIIQSIMEKLATSSPKKIALPVLFSNIEFWMPKFCITTEGPAIISLVKSVNELFSMVQKSMVPARKIAFKHCSNCN